MRVSKPTIGEAVELYRDQQENADTQAMLAITMATGCRDRHCVAWLLRESDRPLLWVRHSVIVADTYHVHQFGIDLALESHNDRSNRAEKVVQKIQMIHETIDKLEALAK